MAVFVPNNLSVEIDVRHLELYLLMPNWYCGASLPLYEDNVTGSVTSSPICRAAEIYVYKTVSTSKASWTGRGLRVPSRGTTKRWQRRWTPSPNPGRGPPVVENVGGAHRENGTRNRCRPVVPSEARGRLGYRVELDHSGGLSLVTACSFRPGWCCRLPKLARAVRKTALSGRVVACNWPWASMYMTGIVTFTTAGPERNAPAGVQINVPGR